MRNTPMVSIGLIVYNEERFLDNALDSCLNQTFKDFECILFDDGSTDRTELICRRYAAQDARIRYYRNARNMGAGWNAHRVYELARGKYFKQVTPGDMIQPDFLRLCLDALEADDSLVLAHSLTRVIDESGGFVEDEAEHLRTSSIDPVIRARDLLFKAHKGYPISGLIRRDALHRLPPRGSCPDSVLLLQLGLMGRFYEVPEYLSISIRDPGHIPATGVGPEEPRQIVFPEWNEVKAFCLSTAQSPLSLGQRLRCYGLIAKWVMKSRRPIAQDLLIAGRQLLFNPHRHTLGSAAPIQAVIVSSPANVVSFDLGIRRGECI